MLRRVEEAGSAVATWLQSLIASRRARSITFEYACRRAQRGAKYLDRTDPWWFRNIRIPAPPGSSDAPKILGQLQGTFLAGLAASGELDLREAAKSGPSPVELGFLSVRAVSVEKQRQDSVFLNLAWHEELRCRREKEEAEVAILMHSIEVSVAAFRSTDVLALPATRAAR